MLRTLATTLLLSLIVAKSDAQQLREYPASLVREEQVVMVDGVAETWQLRWAKAPAENCGPKTQEAFTCPCQGFAFGEEGELSLVRLREGRQIDRLALGTTVLQRWLVDPADSESAKEKDFASEVRSRATVKVMDFADYDHDGEKTEFYLQREAVPCGKSSGEVIGVSKTNPKLHSFASLAHPTEPLVLFKWEWEALRDSKTGKADVLDWECGDHASETHNEVHLEWSARGISGTRREYSCPQNGEARKLLKESPL